MSNRDSLESGYGGSPEDRPINVPQAIPEEDEPNNAQGGLKVVLAFPTSLSHPLLRQPPPPPPLQPPPATPATPTLASVRRRLTFNMPDSDNDNDAGTPTNSARYKAPYYSGAAKGDTYLAPEGERTETLTAHEWTRRVDTIQEAAKWDDKVTARNAQLALVPGSPAGDWLDNNFTEPFMKKWSTMKPALILIFAAFVSVSDKVDILRSFKQGRKEKVGTYYQRIVKEYRRFTESFRQEHTWTPQPDEATIIKYCKPVFEFHLKSFFALGLRDNLLAEVTKSGQTSLQGMVDVATRAEHAQLQNSARHTIASIDNTTAPNINLDHVDDDEDSVVAAVRQHYRRGRGTRIQCFSRKLTRRPRRHPGARRVLLAPTAILSNATTATTRGTASENAGKRQKGSKQQHLEAPHQRFTTDKGAMVCQEGQRRGRQRRGGFPLPCLTQKTRFGVVCRHKDDSISHHLIHHHRSRGTHCRSTQKAESRHRNCKMQTARTVRHRVNGLHRFRPLLPPHSPPSTTSTHCRVTYHSVYCQQ